MKLVSFDELFLFLLSDIYLVENQIVKQLPLIMEKTYSDELKNTLNTHLNETQEQIKRLDNIFQLLKKQPQQVEWSNDLKNLFNDCNVLLKDNSPSPLLDAAIIAVVQRIEHFEIATYGTLREFSKILDHEDVTDLLKETLKEESKADTLLTKLAEGGMFKKGINLEAAR
jgi:ferritin-like metal-binding protein YciE